MNSRLNIDYLWAVALLLAIGCGDSSQHYSDPVLDNLDAASAQPAVVPYKTIGGHALDAHVFLPKPWTSSDRRVAYIWLHGGGFVTGSPQAGYELARAVSARGFVVILPEYRLSVLEGPGTKINASIADSKSIVRWVRRRAEQLGIDPNRVVAGGHSAGAYLAAAGAILQDFDDGGDGGVRAGPDALLIASGPFFLDGPFLPRVIPEQLTLEDVFPLNHVRPGLPRSIVIHGAKDKLVDPQYAADFAAAMTAAGNPSEVRLIEDGDHFFLSPPELKQRFFGEHLAGLDDLFPAS